MGFLLGRGLGALALLAAIVPVAACTSSGAGSSAGTPAPAPPGSSTPASGGPATASLPALPSSDANRITRAYVTFFDGKTTPAAAARVLQNGPQFAAALRAQAGSQQAKSLTAKVIGIARDPDHPSRRVAKVTFSLLSGGQILLPNSPGLAVEVGGRWRVAAQTFCALLQLQSAAPKQCSDSSVTALPTG